jgi:hypothetical protein
MAAANQLLSRVRFFFIAFDVTVVAWIHIAHTYARYDTGSNCADKRLRLR